MKKTLILAVLCIVTAVNNNTLNGQARKGSWITEGNIGDLSLSSNTSKQTAAGSTSHYDNKSFIINLNPGAGYFLTDRFVAGAILGLGYNSRNWTSYETTGLKSYASSQRGCSIGIRPFIREYFTLNSGNRLYGQLEGGMDLSFNTNRSTGYYENGEVGGTLKNVSDEHTVFAGGLLGFNHFFTDTFAFNTTAGYICSRYKSYYTRSGTPAPPNTKANGKDWTNKFVWNFGFSIFLNCKKGKQIS